MPSQSPTPRPLTPHPGLLEGFKIALFGWLMILLGVVGVSAQTTLFSRQGPALSTSFGRSVAGVGDVDGDGLPDILVGSPKDGTNGPEAGRVEVISGADGSLIFQILGTSAGDQLGYAVAALGDVDGDGMGELLIGIPGDDTAGFQVGATRVVSGATGQTLYTVFGSFHPLNPTPPIGAGVAVSGAGDVNADGTPDFIVGQPGFGSIFTGFWGRFDVYSGVNGSLLYGFIGGSAQEHAGVSVSGAGDMNGDGFDDFLVGTQANFSRAYSGLDGSALFAFTEAPGINGVGVEVTDLGDINGDGRGDVAISALFPGGANPAFVSLYSGLDGSLIRQLSGQTVGDGFGSVMANAGDVDGDLVPDLIVGAPGDTCFLCSQQGFAQVFSGATGSLLATFQESTLADTFASSVAGAGDINLDGHADLAIGVPGFASQGDSGFIRVVSAVTLQGASATILGQGCGAQPGGPLLAQVENPVLGQTFSLLLQNAAPETNGSLLASLPLQTPLTITQGCALFVDPLSFLLVAPVVTDVAGTWTASFSLPQVPLLAGFQVALQAAVWPTAGPLGLDLTNGLLQTWGY